MTHELLRGEARDLGFDVDDLPAVGESEVDPDGDIVNVWDQLGNAEDVDSIVPSPDDGDEVPPVGVDTPGVAEAIRLTDEVDRAIGAGELPDDGPAQPPEEVTDA